MAEQMIYAFVCLYNRLESRLASETQITRKVAIQEGESGMILASRLEKRNEKLKKARCDEQ